MQWKVENDKRVDWNIIQARRGEKCPSIVEDLVGGGWRMEEMLMHRFRCRWCSICKPTTMHRGRSWNGNLNSGLVECLEKRFCGDGSVDATLNRLSWLRWTLGVKIGFTRRGCFDLQVQGGLEGGGYVWWAVRFFFVSCWESLYHRAEAVVRSWYTRNSIAGLLNEWFLVISQLKVLVLSFVLFQNAC